MNTNQHTVTLPIADYEELIASQKDAEQKFQTLKNDLVDILRQASFGTHNRPTLEQVIDIIRGA